MESVGTGLPLFYTAKGTFLPSIYVYTYIYTHQLPLVYLFNLVIFLPTRHLITLYNKIIYYILQYIPNTLDVFRKFWTTYIYHPRLNLVQYQYQIKFVLKCSLEINESTTGCSIRVYQSWKAVVLSFTVGLGSGGTKLVAPPLPPSPGPTLLCL